MSGGEVSSTRLYLGNLPRSATKADIEQLFQSHGHGEITEVKLMNGFGFIEYSDASDARDVVPAFHGRDFMGERLVVQFARGSRRNENFSHNNDRQAPRPRRTAFRMQITGLSPDTSWQDLKDFARQSGLDVVYSEVGRGDGKGFVEYETEPDLRTAIQKLDNKEFKGMAVQCSPDISSPPPPQHRGRPHFNNNHDGDYRRGGHQDRFRSRSPPPGRRGGGGSGGYPPPMDEYYDRRGPPARDFSPRRDGGGYRRRTPPPRDYYENRDRFGRSPRPRGPPMDDYPPPRARYPDEGGYDMRGPPPRRGPGGPGPMGYDADPYMNNGHGASGGRPYDRPPSPRGRPGSPRRGGGGGASGGGGANPGGYDDGYGRRPY